MYTCTHKQITWRAAEGFKAQQHFIYLLDANGQFNAFLGLFDTTDPEIAQSADRVHYSYTWYPPDDLEPGDGYTISVSSPPGTTARSEGFSPPFRLRYPFEYRPGTAGVCQVEFGTNCGEGVRRRTLVCQDMRPMALRALDGTLIRYPSPTTSPSPSTSPSFINCTARGASSWVACVVTPSPSPSPSVPPLNLNLVDSSYCGPYGHPPPVLVPCYQPCPGQTIPLFVGGPWSDCSVLCGGGVQNRTVTCYSPQGIGHV